jgi:hypothetical protein
MGTSLAVWLKLLTPNHLPLCTVALNLIKAYIFFCVREEPSCICILQRVTGSTLVPTHIEMPEIIHEGAPDCLNFPKHMHESAGMSVNVLLQI